MVSHHLRRIQDLDPPKEVASSSGIRRQLGQLQGSAVGFVLGKPGCLEAVS